VRWAWRETNAPPDLVWIFEAVTSGDLERAERLLYVALLVFGGAQLPGGENAVPERFRRVIVPGSHMAAINQAQNALTVSDSVAGAAKILSAPFLH
jgi:hypothetical protein